MSNLFVRCLRGHFARAAETLFQARLRLADWRHGTFPETEADRLRSARLRRLVERGRALGLLEEGEDEVTRAWHEARRRSRERSEDRLG
jgi:hypothetical protein